MRKLPHTVSQYQGTHDRGDVDAALATFTSTATVKDPGHEYHGLDQIRDWLAPGLDAVHLHADSHRRRRHQCQHVARDQPLEGDFPGGVVDLRYRFVLAGDLISELEIAP